MKLDSTMDATAMHARNMPAMDFDTVTGATDTSATTTTTKSATTTPATTTPATTMPAAGLDTIMEGDGHEIAEDNVVAHPNGSVPEQAPGFQLMSLPTELRLMILKEFLQMPRPILFKNSIYVGDRYPSKYVRRPAPFSIVRDRPASVEWFHVAGETITIQQKDMFRIFRVSKTIYMVRTIFVTMTSARKSTTRRDIQATVSITTVLTPLNSTGDGATLLLQKHLRLRQS